MTYESFMKGVANDLENALVLVAPVDTSLLKQSIKCKVVGDTIEVYMIDYALYLEYGTYEYFDSNQDVVLYDVKRKKDMPRKERKSMPKGMEPYPFIRNTFYHKLKDIVAQNAATHLGTEMELSFA
jgi:hypothetical protein